MLAPPPSLLASHPSHPSEMLSIAPSPSVATQSPHATFKMEDAVSASASAISLPEDPIEAALWVDSTRLNWRQQR